MLLCDLRYPDLPQAIGRLERRFRGNRNSLTTDDRFRVRDVARRQRRSIMDDNPWFYVAVIGAGALSVVLISSALFLQ